VVDEITRTVGNFDEAFLDAVRDELARARAKFPRQSRETCLLALGEEVGELMQAHLQAKPIGDYYKEAVQVATMAIRAALDQ
jgi:NTP pyrophosphatase (non-canonical NTP hydrolase)